MKTFIAAYQIVKYMRKYEHIQGYSVANLVSWFKLVWDNQDWNIRHRNELDNTLSKINQLKNSNDKYKEELTFLREASYHKDKTHEAEIIRLKDIIQAKQVQLDKLLQEGK